jgi:hypothetical protein
MAVARILAFICLWIDYIPGRDAKEKVPVAQIIGDIYASSFLTLDAAAGK